MKPIDILGYLMIRMEYLQRGHLFPFDLDLSKELKDLEMNQLAKRTVLDTMPFTIEYELTEQGKSLNKIV